MISPFHRPWNGSSYFASPSLSQKASVYFPGSFLLFFILVRASTYQPQRRDLELGLHAGSNSFGLPYNRSDLISRQAGRCFQSLRFSRVCQEKSSRPSLARILFHTGRLWWRGPRIELVDNVYNHLGANNGSKEFSERIEFCQARLAVAQEHIIRRKRRGPVFAHRWPGMSAKFAALPHNTTDSLTWRLPPYVFILLDSDFFPSASQGFNYYMRVDTDSLFTAAALLWPDRGHTPSTAFIWLRLHRFQNLNGLHRACGH